MQTMVCPAKGCLSAFQVWTGLYQAAVSAASAGFLCRMLFDIEDGDYMFLRNVRVSANFTAL
jgi:hypothetical protein